MLRGNAVAFYHDRLVIWAHELASPYGIHTPKNGAQFGVLKTNLVMRAARVDDDLKITDIDERELVSSVPTSKAVTGSTASLVAGTPVPMPFARTTLPAA